MVAERTGLSPDLIRVWEKRYGAVQPVRTASNRRRYSEREVERLVCC
jgi:DNA-binding transcriptional MerR regulator